MNDKKIEMILLNLRVSGINQLLYVYIQRVELIA